MRSKARSDRSEPGQARLRLVLRVFFMLGRLPVKEGGRGREGRG